MNRLRSHERGQVLALFCLGLVALMGFLALAVDIGMLWTERRHMQTAADAAAVAAAAALTAGDSLGTIQSAGYSAAAANSFTASPETYNGPNPVTVTVNNPPSAGSYAGNAAYVEAIITQPQPTYFLKVLGYDTVSVSTRAVSGAISGPACMYSLDPTDAKTFDVSGGTSRVTSSCGLLVKSTSTDGLDASGGAIVSTGSIGIVGSAYGDSGGSTVAPTPITGIAPFGDPLAYLDSEKPTPGACKTGTDETVATSGNGGTIHPGTYCSGIKVSGGHTLTLSSGLYILTGSTGLTDSASTLTGSGVTIYNTGSGKVTISGGSTANLTAPSSSSGGAIAGILFFQDPNNTADATISGGSAGNLAGALYFPTALLTFSGGSSVDPQGAVLVGYKITISGGTYLTSNYAAIGGQSPIKSDTLYE